MTISAAFRTDSITSPRALHTPTCPGVSPLSRAHGAAPDTALERGSLARELQHKGGASCCDSSQVRVAKTVKMHTQKEGVCVGGVKIKRRGEAGMDRDDGREREKRKGHQLRETKKEREAPERDLETCHHLLKVIA